MPATAPSPLMATSVKARALNFVHRKLLTMRQNQTGIGVRFGEPPKVRAGLALRACPKMSSTSMSPDRGEPTKNSIES